MHRFRSTCPRLPFCAALVFLLLLLFLGCASADNRHTVLLKCEGSGFAGTVLEQNAEIILKPDETIPAADGSVWTPAAFARLPGFHLEYAVLRWTADDVRGLGLPYALLCGRVMSSPQYAVAGRNLWDVTAPVAAWLSDPDSALSFAPMYQLNGRGLRIRENSVYLLLTFSASADLPLFPQDRVREDTLYDAGLSMLYEGSPIVARYDDTADSLLQVSLPLGVPYFYTGSNEDKFLLRRYPGTITHYFRYNRLYFCGLDCVGMTRLVYEKRGLAAHPSIVDILYTGAGTVLLRALPPDQWPALLLPGDLIAVQHGTYHVMMYLGTLRQFGWTEADAGEAASLLDSPLVLHSGGDPFYYERYQAYIKEKGFRNTYPPDGGVTVSVIRQTDTDAPHQTDTSWGKHFGWYLIDGQPLLVFRLEDCTQLAWYGDETLP